MSDVQRCDECGARNPAGAGWCTQCYERLGNEPTIAAPPAAVSSGSASSAAVPTAAPPPPPPAPPRSRPVPPTDGLLPLPPSDRPATTGDADAAPVRTGDGRFRQAADGLEWRCEVCEYWNVIEQADCTACSAPFMEPTTTDAPDRSDVAPPLLIAATVALPGAGHALLGDWAQAFFRALLAIVWGVGGLALLTNALSSGQPVLPAIPLLLGWLFLVAASVNDVAVAASGRGRVLLQGRAVLWLVVGVIGATISSAFVSALAAVAG